jgi:hypothetical protein
MSMNIPKTPKLHSPFGKSDFFFLENFAHLLTQKKAMIHKHEFFGKLCSKLPYFEREKIEIITSCFSMSPK